MFQEFGALPFIYGTVVSSPAGPADRRGPIALGPPSTCRSWPPTGCEAAVLLVELLAAIPSVVYGLWGIFVLAPLLRSVGSPS